VAIELFVAIVVGDKKDITGRWVGPRGNNFRWAESFQPAEGLGFEFGLLQFGSAGKGAGHQSLKQS
jgi:hypothetical protein